MSLTKMTKQLEEATGKPKPSRAFMETYEEREQQQRALERQDMLLHQKQVEKTVARSEADARQYQSNTDKLLERSQRFMERMIARGEANARQHQVDTDRTIAANQARAEKTRAEDQARMDRTIADGQARAEKTRAEDQARMDRTIADGQARAEKTRAEDRAEDQARFDRFTAEVNQRLTAMEEKQRQDMERMHKDLSFLRWTIVGSVAAFGTAVAVFAIVVALVSVFT